jgi:hypothetical protein
MTERTKQRSCQPPPVTGLPRRTTRGSISTSYLKAAYPRSRSYTVSPRSATKHGTTHQKRAPHPPHLNSPLSTALKRDSRCFVKRGPPTSTSTRSSRTRIALASSINLDAVSPVPGGAVWGRRCFFTFGGDVILSVPTIAIALVFVVVVVTGPPLALTCM